MASEVKILLTATDNASKVIKQTTSGLGGMKSGLDGTLKSLTGFGLSTFTALGAVTALAGGIKKVVNETVEYGKQVDDLSRALGTSTEEASKLIQIADDLRIDVGSLQTAFRIALKQGILPSVDGLKDLGAEYKALKTPAEKAQFALKTFGRSGLQMQKILELDAKALDEMAKSAEEAGLVMSRDSVEATKAYWKELDNLSDRFTGLKINIGTHVIPALTGMIGALDEVAFKADWSGKAIDQQFNQALLDIPEISGRAGTGIQDAAKAIDNLDIELGDSSSHWLPAFDASARTAAGGVDELGDAAENVLDPMAEFREHTRKLREQQQGLLEDLRKIKEQKIEDFFDIDIDPETMAKRLFDITAFKEAGGEALNTVLDAIKAGVAEGKISEPQAAELFTNVAIQGEALKVKLGEISAEEAAESISQDFGLALEDATERLDLVLQGVDAINMADVSKITNNFDRLQERKDLLMKAGEIPLTADPGNRATSKLIELKDKVKYLDETNFFLDIYIRTHGTLPKGKQFGGPVSAGQPYIVGERGPELFVPNTGGRIVPNVNMGGVNVNINAAGSDAAEIYKMFKRELSREARNARNAGASFIGV